MCANMADLQNCSLRRIFYDAFLGLESRSARVLRSLKYRIYVCMCVCMHVCMYGRLGSKCKNWVFQFVISRHQF